MNAKRKRDRAAIRAEQKRRQAAVPADLLPVAQLEHVAGTPQVFVWFPSEKVARQVIACARKAGILSHE